MSHLFAYFSRMKFIRRWALMHNTYPENIQEHSLRVAQIAHALAVISNERFGAALQPDRAATLALYHDASEVLTGDLPTPVKYFNPHMRRAYGEIEQAAGQRLLEMVPDPLRPAYDPLLRPVEADRPYWELVRAADKLCAWIKCIEEVTAGNREFIEAEKTLGETVAALDRPEVTYFVETFVPSFRLTIDELK
jgi:5'-deoxynucleotidase